LKKAVRFLHLSLASRQANSQVILLSSYKLS